MKNLIITDESKGKISGLNGRISFEERDGEDLVLLSYQNYPIATIKQFIEARIRVRRDSVKLKKWSIRHEIRGTEIHFLSPQDINFYVTTKKQLEDF